MPATAGPVDRPQPSAVMRRLGILPAADPLLRRVATRFTLPADAAEAARIRDVLLARSDLIRAAHNFSKGMGLAAPQLGFGRRMAILRPPGDSAPIVLLNPQLMACSAEQDQPRYEGCLSFFDVRGLVRRPMSIHVAHQQLTGEWLETTFTGSMGRLVAHEIDHLDGVLYTERMPAGELPIPIREYHGTGVSWGY